MDGRELIEEVQRRHRQGWSTVDGVVVESLSMEFNPNQEWDSLTVKFLVKRDRPKMPKMEPRDVTPKVLELSSTSTPSDPQNSADAPEAGPGGVGSGRG